jgi:hypothetical protein
MYIDYNEASNLANALVVLERMREGRPGFWPVVRVEDQQTAIAIATEAYANYWGDLKSRVTPDSIASLQQLKLPKDISNAARQTDAASLHVTIDRLIELSKKLLSFS